MFETSKKFQKFTVVVKNKMMINLINGGNDISFLLQLFGVVLRHIDANT